MRDRLTIVFGILVLAPVVLLALLGAKVARDEQTMVEARLGALREDRLAGLAAEVRHTIELSEAELGATLSAADPRDPEALRDLVRAHPLVAQVFVVGPDGALLFPRADGATETERAFLTRTEAIWRGKAILADLPQPERGDRGYSRGDSLGALAARRSKGWVTWYWEEGLHLLFWQARPDRSVIGVEVDRVGLVARLVGALPELEVEDGRVALLDLRGGTLYQWGQGEPTAGERPRAKRALDHPLESYSLADYPGGAGLLAEGTQVSLWASLIAAVGVLVGLASYFHRERSREAREARQKVSFVTQVSHELKTPLTNIRMYAELLAEDVDALDDGEGANEPAKQHLAVVVSESQRLSRLIHNILSFSRHGSGKPSVRADELALRPVAEQVIAQFAPSFAAKGLSARLEGDARARGDADAVGQILGNLLSNVEKYAAEGRAVEIAISDDEAGAKLTVRDHGRGVRREDLGRIFEPFVRFHDKLSDGATGTGIGLTIAAELARAMGGALSVEPAEPGLRFTLTLPRVTT